MQEKQMAPKIGLFFGSSTGCGEGVLDGGERGGPGGAVVRSAAGGVDPAGGVMVRRAESCTLLRHTTRFGSGQVVLGDDGAGGEGHRSAPRPASRR